MESTSHLDSLCPIPQSSAVKRVKTIIETLYQGSDIGAIRIAVADLMEQQLKRGEDANNKTALPYFINALGSLSLSVTSQNRLSSVGLYPCLIDLENAIATLDGNESKHLRSYGKNGEELSYKFLIESLESIRKMPTFSQ